MNKVELDGRIGREPQIRETKNGNQVASFTIATNETFQTAAGWQENTTWHRIVMWNDVLETVKENLKVGERLHIQGRLSNRSYEDKNGERKYITEVVATSAKIFQGAVES
ncbi:MAG: single-stranded DNA-binding protein [Marinilabiliales bacterium]|nr:MAG: single-stranded DNA-binding protein [Marinilabiliales bacterium]